MNVGSESKMRVPSGFLGGGVAAFVGCSVADFAMVKLEAGEGGQAASRWGFEGWEKVIYSPVSRDNCLYMSRFHLTLRQSRNELSVETAN